MDEIKLNYFTLLPDYEDSPTMTVVPPLPQDANKVVMLNNVINQELRRLRRLKSAMTVIRFNHVSFKLYVTDSVEEAAGRFWIQYFK